MIFKPNTFIILSAFYLLGCSPDLAVDLGDQPTGITKMEKLSGRLGDNNKPGIAYPYTVYTAYDSIYSEDTKTFINGTEVESFKGASGKVSFIIPEGLKNGKLDIRIEGASEAVSIDNVFYLDDPSIPLYSGNPAMICDNQQFYNSSGELTQGKLNCSNLTTKPCEADGETNCVASINFPAAS